MKVLKTTIYKTDESMHKNSFSPVSLQIDNSMLDNISLVPVYTIIPSYLELGQ